MTHAARPRLFCAARGAWHSAIRSSAQPDEAQALRRRWTVCCPRTGCGCPHLASGPGCGRRHAGACRPPHHPHRSDAERPRPRRGHHQADHRLLQARAVRADAGRRRHVEEAPQPGRLLAVLGQHHLRGRRHVQARQRAVPQALGVVAILDPGIRRARAAVQCARLPELPSEGRPRPSAGGQSPTRPRCSCGLPAPPRRTRRRQAIADRAVLNFPDPVYGGQLQDLAVPGLAGEGTMAITYEEIPVTLGDGTKRLAAQAELFGREARLRPARSRRRRCRRASRRR